MDTRRRTRKQAAFLVASSIHTHTHTRAFAHLICDAVMQNILRLNTNAESMHMFDLL